jgi:hypothetical protein
MGQVILAFPVRSNDMTSGRRLDWVTSARFRDVRDKSALPSAPKRLRQHSEPILRAIAQSRNISWSKGESELDERTR